MNYESLRKYKVGIYIKFCHMLRGKIFEKNEEIRIGGQICPLPVCLGLKEPKYGRLRLRKIVEGVNQYHYKILVIFGSLTIFIFPFCLIKYI